jgi:PTH1 family peptidyl-tRNA hydrolase
LIRLIVGLGNPGREYENTRHNVGYWWVDEIAQSQKIHFKNEAKFQGLLGRGILDEHDTLLLKPQTFMNHSGRAVGAVAQFYKIEPNEILVLHDELDLEPGVARLKLGGGHGGHNGLKDIITHLGTKDFWRVRFGIGHPGDRTQVASYVLNPPCPDELELIVHAMDKTRLVARLIMSGKTEAAMLKLHSTS